MNIGKVLLDKFKQNPVKVIGTVLTCLGLTLFLLPVLMLKFDSMPEFDETTEMFLFICALVLVVAGPILLIISWIINKELMKESAKLFFIGCGWLVISVFGVGHWLANTMILTSFVLIASGMILPIIAWIIKKLK